MYRALRGELLDCFSLLYLCLTVCSAVLFSALQRDRSVQYDSHFLLIMFSKHIFHLLLTVLGPHLSYSPPPCSLGPRFNSPRLYPPACLLPSFTTQGGKWNNRNFISYKSSMALLRADWLSGKLAWRIWAANTTYCFRLMCFLSFTQNPSMYFALFWFHIKTVYAFRKKTSLSE